MLAGLNPWVAMWNQPRSTIRAITHSNPTYGIYSLASIYALQSFFFYANWWSLGLSAHYSLKVVLGVLLSPLIGLVWLYFMGLIFYLTGRIFKGAAPASHLRAAVAWSSIPYSISLAMWLMLVFLSPSDAFIHDSVGISSLFVNIITIIISVWSLVLLIQSIRDLQRFSVGISILNVLLAWIFSSILFLIFLSVLRYFHISFSA